MNLAVGENASFDERGEFMAAARLEYLRDERGVYGVSIPILIHDGPYALTYVLRPDRLDEELQGRRSRSGYVRGAALQTLPRHIFGKGRYIESGLTVALAEAIHARGGFVGDSRRGGYEWWADSKADQLKNQRRYHGQNRMADRIAGYMIREVLEVADQGALKTARRFPMGHRYGIYRAAAISRRAHQLIETFPYLGAEIYCSDPNKQNLSRLVEIGTPIKRIASELDFPIMALRKVKPGAIGKAFNCRPVFTEQPDLIHAYLPETLPAQRRWLRAIRCAMPFGPPFVEWVARNVNEMPGRTILEIESQVENVSDWIKASYRVSVDEALAAIPQYMIDAYADVTCSRLAADGTPNYVTRRFSSDMSLRTVFELSDEWHETVANHQPNHSTPFPEPWAGPADVDGYQIAPITNSADLYREGKRMRHCVGSYAYDVTGQRCYFYHVEKEGKPIATVELLRNGTKPTVGHTRGPCNAIVDKKIMQILRKWVRQIKEVPAVQTPGLTGVNGPHLVQNGDGQWLEDIPF